MEEKEPSAHGVIEATLNHSWVKILYGQRMQALTKGFVKHPDHHLAQCYSQAFVLALEILLWQLPNV